MVTLFTDPRMLDHIPPRGHPERPERLQAILRHLERTGLAAACPAGRSARRPTRRSLRVHTPEHLAARRAVRPGRRRGDRGRHLDVVRLAAGGPTGGGRGGRARSARWSRGPTDARACLVRPPGHHAARTGRWGSACSATSPSPRPTPSQSHGIDRVLIVDFDVHHGNGTQEIFYDDPRVAFLSIHRYPVLSRHRRGRRDRDRARRSG